jgi:hypothetical protein
LASNSGNIVQAAMEAEDRLAGLNINKKWSPETMDCKAVSYRILS